MRVACDEVLNLRLPSDLMRDLDGAARASGAGLSSTARKALALGLRTLCGPSNDDGPDAPPPAAPAVTIRAAA